MKMDTSSAVSNAETRTPAAGRQRTADATKRARRREGVLAQMMLMSDLVAAVVGAGLGLALVGDLDGSGLVFIGATIVVWPLAAFVIGLYGSDQLSTWASVVADIPGGLVAALISTWPLFGIAVALDLGEPFLVAGVTLVLLCVLATIGRSVVRAYLHRSPELLQRTLIVGSGVVAGNVVDKIQKNNQFGLVPVGIVDDDPYEVGSPDLPWLGRIAGLDMVIKSKDIDRVIITFSRAGHENLLEAIRASRDARVPIDIVPRLFEFLDGVRALDQVGGLPLLSVGASSLSRISMAAKRTLDLVGAALLLIVLSPIMFVVAAAIKLESRGPVFFRQPRAGRGDEQFQLIKFRSMYVDAERRKSELQELNESDDGVMFKIREDPRVTKVGRILRRFSIDELPQLFNVLTGDMSLVGPRPLIQEEIAALETEWHLRRRELRPGLTGPWQIYGRSQSPFQEMVRFDYQYVSGWSLARDIELLLATIPAVLSGRGAY
jgi:exopolysaccharide biosynthesis polyprenyl glycosylphosphotransferase